MGELSAYEQQALEECVRYRETKLVSAPERLVPGRVQERATAISSKVKAAPGADKAGKLAGAAYGKAMGGAVRALNRTTDLTLSEKRVVRSYARRSHDVTDLSDIRRLDLSAVDQVSHLRRLRTLYAATAGAEGAVAAGAITGGTALTAAGGIAGQGAGAAPGVGAVAAASGADAAATLVLASHVVAHTALYYGYDYTKPQEELFAMQVIGLGMASTQGAKAAAFGEVSKLTQMLAKNAPWAKLNTTVLAKVAQKFATRFGFDLTKKKLGQFVPVAGVLVGAGLNFRAIDDIAEAANWAYRERFLRDKISVAAAEGEVIDVEVVDEGGEAEHPILVLEILDEVESDETGGGGRSEHA